MASDMAFGVPLSPVQPTVPQPPAHERWTAEGTERSIWPSIGIGALIGAGVGALVTSIRYDPRGADFISPQMAYGFGIASGAAAGALVGASFYRISDS